MMYALYNVYVRYAEYTFKEESSMQGDKIILQRPEPLSDGGKSLSIIYIIATICGLILGIIFEVAVGGYWGLFILGFTVFGFLIGWGIKNKIVKYKCLYLERLIFHRNNVIPYSELWNRLIPIFTSMNIRMSVNQDGSICVPYNGVMYDIILNNDNSFRIRWRQTFGQSLLRWNYYIPLYKKVVVDMGMIAFHVQNVCR